MVSGIMYQKTILQGGRRNLAPCLSFAEEQII